MGVFALLAGQITGISLAALILIPVKRVLKNYWTPVLSRIDSVIISAQTVRFSGLRIFTMIFRNVSREIPIAWYKARIPIFSGASLRREDFAPREPEFGVEFWDANFGAPNFGAEF